MARTYRTQQARRFALLALLAAEGTPLTDRALRDHIRQGVGGTWTELDLGDVIRDLDLDQLISGTASEVRNDTVWLLTEKGEIHAKQLR